MPMLRREFVVNSMGIAAVYSAPNVVDVLADAINLMTI
jgi:hypothetical protein